jgi:hypothetical protein
MATMLHYQELQGRRYFDSAALTKVKGAAK